MWCGSKRITSFIKKGSLVEYEDKKNRHIGIVILVKWKKRYGKTEIVVLRSTGVHTVFIMYITRIISF